KPGDVCIGITTSGESPNVTEALQVARKMDVTAAALSGKSGGMLAGLADPLLIVPSQTTARIQEMHIMLGQMLCDVLEQRCG
ncbi:MAG: SIS domain-containing protein, partial [Alphaproteobacteria bacterium]